MKTYKSIHPALKILALAIILLGVYGVATDCPNTAGYVYCSAPERWELLH